MDYTPWLHGVHRYGASRERVSHPEVLPEGAVLVHIGPYKTGTTAIQFSLELHRDALLEHGVLYPGKGHRQRRPGYALMGRTPSGLTPATAQEWDDLAKEVRATSRRVCISSEDLASAEVPAIRKLVDDLGPDRVHVLIVVRRLDRVLPSAWQERVKSWNETMSYDQWLRDVLVEDPTSTGAARRFWRNHGVAQLLARWTEALPPEQCILLVSDEQDRTQQMRAFERLLNLPERLLTPGRRDNTSLTLNRIEMIRRVNELFDTRDWDAEHRRNLIYRGLIKGLRRAPANEGETPIPPLPAWAVERVSELSDRRAAEVAGSGARVIGDPNGLRMTPASQSDEVTSPQTVPIETAAKGIEALLEAALTMEHAAVRAARDQPRVPSAPSAPTVEATSSRHLLGVVARRGRARLRRALRTRSLGGGLAG
jgi:hypothetical protein